MHLAELNIRDNHATNIDFVCGLPSLRSLDASMNRISRLPLSMPLHLITINLAKNVIAGDLSNLDYSSSSLAVVSFAGNPTLRHLPDLGLLVYDLDISNTSVGLLVKLPLLTRLCACSINLTDLPEIHAPLLTDLYLSGNQLTKVDTSACMIPSLRKLLLDCNYNLVHVNLSTCEKLNYLDLSYTCISSHRLPPCLCTLVARDTCLTEKTHAEEVTTWKLLQQRNDQELQLFNRLHCDGGVFQFGPAQLLMLSRKRKFLAGNLNFLIDQLRCVLFGYPAPQLPLAEIPLHKIIQVQRRWRRRMLNYR